MLYAQARVIRKIMSSSLDLNRFLYFVQSPFACYMCEVLSKMKVTHNMASMNTLRVCIYLVIERMIYFIHFHRVFLTFLFDKIPFSEDLGKLDSILLRESQPVDAIGIASPLLSFHFISVKNHLLLFFFLYPSHVAAMFL